MLLPTIAEPAPITFDDDGVARVGGTRVTLETVVGAFKDGLSAEQIVQKYSSLKLVDVYAIITYYLRAKDDVEAYLEEQRQLAERVRRENEARFPSEGIKARLLARRWRELKG